MTLLGAPAVALLMALGAAAFVPATASAQAAPRRTPPRRAVPTQRAQATQDAVALDKVWSTTITDATTGTVVLSSPTLATLQGGPAVVFGDRSGNVEALNLKTGDAVPGWPRHVGAPVTSTPSAFQAPGSPVDTVLVGVGNASKSCGGGYEWLLPGGASVLVHGPNPREDRKCRASGVFSGISIGTLGGTTAAVAGTLGQETYAFNALTRHKLPGFPWFQADSNFATPAIAQMMGNGANQIVEGGAQTAGYAFKKRYRNGGHIRILSASGHLICEDVTNESINSSPAVGGFLAGTAQGIVVGTGPTFPTASQRDEVIALNDRCHQVWSRKLAGTTGYESPALADVVGNGHLQVVVATRTGVLEALDGATGATLWRTALPHQVIGSPVTAELGTGKQDVVVCTLGGFDVVTGTTGTILDATVLGSAAFQNAPIITQDADGTVGITVVGYQRHDSVAAHFEIVGSSATNVDAPGAWPEFHHDPQLTGNAG